MYKFPKLQTTIKYDSYENEDIFFSDLIVDISKGIDTYNYFITKYNEIIDKYNNFCDYYGQHKIDETQKCKIITHKFKRYIIPSKEVVMMLNKMIHIIDLINFMVLQIKIKISNIINS